MRLDLIVHETNTETTDEHTPIQEIFGLIVDDQVRTSQICSDVQEAVDQKRTCLVLTQRTDHIDSIVDHLAQRGHRALVLKGGLGKKARTAVMDELADVRPESGVVLVATGSYLGEGFDWPACDTLFLAFPVAFKGRVVQYVGRLLRTEAGKRGVELHDYVDVRIPVLDRMHDKRRPVYASLGFEVPKRPRRRRAAGSDPAGDLFEAF